MPCQFLGWLPVFEDFLQVHRMWGLAAFYGARAYNDTDLRTEATAVWEVANLYTVSVQDGMRGSQSTRNASFPVNCIANGMFPK